MKYVCNTLQLQSWDNPTTELDIEIEFTSFRHNGILLLIKQNEFYGAEILSLELKDRYVGE